MQVKRNEGRGFKPSTLIIKGTTFYFFIKIVLLSLLDAVAVFVCILFYLEGNFIFLGSVAVGALLLNWLVLSERSYPFRYLVPGLIFLVAMVVFPMGYTAYISLTNYSTGHILTKQQVIDQLIWREYVPKPPVQFSFLVFADTRGKLAAVLLQNEQEQYVVFSDARWEPAANYQLVDENGDGTPDRLNGWSRIDRHQIPAHLSQLQTLRVPFQEGWLRLATLTKFQLYFPKFQYNYDQDLLVNQQTGKVFRPIEGRFIAEDGETLDPGWTEYVGLRNFIRLATTPRYRGPFFRVFLWTVEWSFFTVLFSFALGLGLAILLNDPKMRLCKLYRSLLIIPYAMPSFISILTWRGFFNTELGFFNQVLRSWFGIRIPWLTEFFWARFSLVLMNVWLTYPYMMLISLGALQSIPKELYEAARVDRAGAWQRFSYITLPLLMISIAPLLIGSFAVTFNNFTIIWLLTEGGPVVRIGEPAGATDILISYAYKLAFLGLRGNEMALSSTLAVVIFVIIITISAVAFWRTHMLEEVYHAL